MRTQILSLALLFASVVCCAEAKAQEGEGGKELEEVVVKSNIPYVKLENGNISFNPKTVVGKRSINNALDILRYVPGLSLTDDSPMLSGVHRATILLNGQNTGASNEQLYLYLQSLAPEHITSIELMPIAPSHTGVQGAAINIIIDLSKAPKGISSLITAMGSVGKYSSGDLRVGVHSVSQRWDNNLIVSIAKNNSGSETHTSNIHTLPTGIVPVIQNTLTEIGVKGYTLQLNSDYRINDNNKLSLMGYIMGSKRDSYNLGDVLINNTAPHHRTGVATDSREQFYHINAGYQNPNIANLGLTYSYYNGLRDVVTQPLEPNNRLTIYNSHSKQVYRSLAYNISRSTQILPSLALTYGVLGNHNITSNSSSVFSHESSTSRDYPTDNTEYEHSVHAQLSYALSPKIDMKLGATLSVFHRDKTIVSEAISDTRVLPKLQLTYSRDKDNIYLLSIDAQRAYPSYDELSNIQLSRNLYSVYMGNPYLVPSISYTANLQYILKQKYSFSLWAKHTLGEKIVMPYQLPDKLTSVIKPVNLDYQNQIGFTFATGMELSSVPGLAISGNISGIYLHQSLDKFNALRIDKKKVFVVGSFRAEYSVPGLKGLRLGVDATGNTESIQGIYRIKPMFRIDPWINYTFWGGRATLSISFIDVFNTYRPHTIIEELGQQEEMKQWNFLRRVQISFTYRIGRNKQKDKLPAPDIERYMQVKPRN